MRLKIDMEKLDVDGNYIDVTRWFTRYELFFDLQMGEKEEHKTVDKTEIYLRYLPLYLTGSALLCFEELPLAEKESYSIVKERLAAFHKIDRTTAYANFISSVYTGNGVDLFVAELRRYLGVLNITLENANVLILEQFLKGIPASSAAEIRSRCTKDAQPMSLETVIGVARHLPSLQMDQNGNLVGHFQGHKNSGQGRGKGKGRSGEETRKPSPHTTEKEKPACFACGDTAHKMNACPLLKALRSQNQGNFQGPVSSASTLGPQIKAVQH